MSSPQILPPFAFLPQGNGYSNTQLDMLDKIYQALSAIVSPVPSDIDNQNYTGGWVIDQSNDIYWLEVVTVGETKQYNYYDAPGGSPASPVGVVRPTTLPNITFNTIRLDGSSATQTATAYQAPRPGADVAQVNGTVGREYVIASGFRFMSIVFLPQCTENAELTINGLSYSASFGDFAGRALPERGSKSYNLKIDEEYTIIASAGCQVEITEVR